MSESVCPNCGHRWVPSEDAVELRKWLFGQWLDHYCETTGRSMRGSKSARHAFNGRISDGLTLDELKLATEGAHSDRWLRQNGFDVPETILAAKNVNRYIALASNGSKPRRQLVRPENV